MAQVAVAVIVEMRHDVGGQRLDLGARKRNRRGLRRRRRRQVVDLLDRIRRVLRAVAVRRASEGFIRELGLGPVEEPLDVVAVGEHLRDL